MRHMLTLNVVVLMDRHAHRVPHLPEGWLHLLATPSGYTYWLHLQSIIKLKP